MRRANLVYGQAARLDGTIHGLMDASDTMALNAIQAYIDVVRHAQLIQIARQNIADHVRIERQVRDAVDGGKLPASDGITVSDRVLAARLALEDVEIAYEGARVRYESIVGHLPSHPMRVTAPQNLPRSRGALVRNALANSAKIAAAGSLVDELASEQGVVEASRSPRVTLNADVSAGANLNGSRGNENSIFVGARVTWTLYEAGRREGEAAAAALTHSARERQEAARREVREVAAQAWVAYLGALERRKLLRRQETANTKIVRQQRDEFEAGERTLLDLLETERALFNVKFQRVSADHAITLAQYRMLAAQSSLARQFGVEMSGMPLLPNYAAQAQANPRATVFQTRVAPFE